VVLDLARDPSDANGAVAVGLSGTDAQLWQTKDSGVTFTTLGDVISGFIPTTVDVAPSDAGVIYVSGLTGTQGALLRSTDGGKSFETLAVPNTSTAHRPYIAAIDPNDARTVYLRLDGEPSTLEITHDGGDTFVSPLSTTVPALGFALSPDGSTVVASNSYDGTFRADTTTLEFEKVACGGPSCLSFGPAGLFGCGDELVDGFIVGRSDDLGATFERVLDLTCVRGPATCGDDTSIGMLCPDAWPAVRDQIGANECAPVDKAPYTGCFAAGAGGEGGAGSGTAAAANTGGAIAASPSPPNSAAHAKNGGCGCRAGARPNRDGAWIFALGLGSLVVKRRRRKPRRDAGAREFRGDVP
jgi:MYXO-CTERM domain-containing protein